MKEFLIALILVLFVFLAVDHQNGGLAMHKISGLVHLDSTGQVQ